MGKYRSFINVLCTLLLCEVCLAGVQFIGKVSPGFEGAQLNWIDNDGMFLISDNGGEFAFCFITTTKDTTKFLLGVVHVATSTLVWSANKANPVSNSDNFVFDDKGNALLQKGGTVIWSTNTSGKGVSSMELKETGNLVLLGNDNSTIIWQSFNHPRDTLLSKQDFTEGMKLVSEPRSNNFTYVFEIKSGILNLIFWFRFLLVENSKF